ncbi:hypothetical protein [Rhizobium skierniewicense]|uniref:hypothetical protein n=1 Tax=Rhizobium skierniewicense TaxID=984260 RepID=UPI0015729C65|nr:hypothetical protein [Rhizobium skierniewicense]NTF34246.1 hypothetical protein [Rhizobium skierniewicense]
MVDISHSSWTERDADNNAPSPNGIQIGFAPSTVSQILQATKGAIKRERNRINAFYTTTGTATALVLTLQVTPNGLTKGDRYAFFSSQTNTGEMTLNVNGLGPKQILQKDGAALKAGQIVAGSATTVIYDGTAFCLENYVSNPKFTGTLTVDAVEATTLTGAHVGNGSGLTNLNALSLTGTIDDARLPATMAGKTFSTQVTANSGVNITGALNVSGAFTANGTATVGGSRVLTMADFGAGNGLDADKL